MPGFDADDWFENPKEARRTDRRAVRAAAAQQALEQAGDLNPDPDRAGVIIGTGVGGLNTLENRVQTYYMKGPAGSPPSWSP